MAGAVNYIEKGPGLHRAVWAAGHRLWHQDGVTYADDPVAVQAIIDAYVEVPPVPEQVTLRQLLFALVGGGYITQAEALGAARTGAMPATLLALANNASPAEAFAIELTWAAMTVAYRTDPLWNMIVAAGIVTSAQVDDLFRVGATI